MLNILTKLNNTPYQGLSIHRLGITIAIEFTNNQKTPVCQVPYIWAVLKRSHITSQKKVFSHKSCENPFMNIRQISVRHV